MSSHSLWFDEQLSLTRIDGSNLGVVLDQLKATQYDKYQPIYFISLFFWQKLFGDSVSAARALSAFFGGLSVVLTITTASKIYGRTHGLWTALLVSFSAFHVYYSQEVRAYALVMFIASLELLCFSVIRFTENKKRTIYTLFFWIIAIFGFLSSLFIVFLTLSICIADWFIKRKFKNWTFFWSPLLVCSLPALYLYLSSPYWQNLSFYLSSGLETWSGTHILQNILFSIYGLLVGTTYSIPIDQLRYNQVNVVADYWMHIGLFLLASSAIGVGVIERVTNREEAISNENITQNDRSLGRANAFFFLLIITAFAVSTAFTLLTNINWAPRHSAYIYPAIAVLLPSSFCFPEPRKSWARAVRKSSLVGVFLLIALNIYSLNNYFFNPAHARDDYRSAAQYVMKQSSPDSSSVLLWGEVKILRRYGDTKTEKMDLGGIQPEALPEALLAFTDNADRITVLVNREYLLGYSVEPAISTQYDLQKKVEFSYFDIYELEQK